MAIPKYVKELDIIYRRADKLWTDFGKLRLPSKLKKHLDKDFENLTSELEEAVMEVRGRSGLPERY